jgi:hypothetical protein
MCASASRGFLKDEHLTLLSIVGQGIEEMWKYPWLFFVDATPELCPFEIFL